MNDIFEKLKALAKEYENTQCDENCEECPLNTVLIHPSCTDLCEIFSQINFDYNNK